MMYRMLKTVLRVARWLAARQTPDRRGADHLIVDALYDIGWRK